MPYFVAVSTRSAFDLHKFFIRETDGRSDSDACVWPLRANVFMVGLYRGGIIRGRSRERKRTSLVIGVFPLYPLTGNPSPCTSRLARNTVFKASRGNGAGNERSNIRIRVDRKRR